MNAMYDGDVLSGCIALSRKQYDDFEYFRPHYGIHSFVKLGELNGNCSLPETDIGVINSWFEYEEDELGIVAER
jgi:hypothetical protein